MADLGWPEILVVAIAAFALFGWKHLPDASRSLGRSIRIFRSEISQMHAGAPDASASDPTPSPRPE